MNRFFLSIIILSLSVGACDDAETDSEIPNCIESKINIIKEEEVRNPPAEIWEWKVSSETYYYITSDCCDQFNYLFDQNCNKICAPDGGFSGLGDGNCPDFSGHIEKTLIWKDDRK